MVLLFLFGSGSSVIHFLRCCMTILPLFFRDSTDGLRGLYCEIWVVGGRVYAGAEDWCNMSGHLFKGGDIFIGVGVNLLVTAGRLFLCDGEDEAEAESVTSPIVDIGLFAG